MSGYLSVKMFQVWHPRFIRTILSMEVQCLREQTVFRVLSFWHIAEVGTDMFFKSSNSWLLPKVVWQFKIKEVSD